MITHALHQITALILPTWAAWLPAYILLTSFALAFLMIFEVESPE